MTATLPSMTREDAPPREENQPIIGPNSAIRVGFVVVLAGVVWWGATLTSDVNTIKTNIARLSTLDSIGARLESVTSRLDTLEKRGSEPLQNLQKSVDAMAADMKLHILTTEKKQEK